MVTQESRRPPNKEGWRKVVDRDVSLWATFVSNMTQYKISNDPNNLTRAKDALVYLFDVLEGGKYNHVMFTEFKDDAVVGGYSNIGSVDVFADYLVTTARPLFIKKMPIPDALQAHNDAEFALKNFRRDQFYLAPARFQPLEYDDFALFVTQIVPGPDIGEIFRVLNGEIERGNTSAQRIKSMILGKNLDDLILWQENFHKTVPEEIAIVERRPDAIISRYKLNTQGALKNAERLTYAKPNLSFVVPDSENELIELAIQLFDKLNLSNQRMARIRDDTETNSGLELGRMKFREGTELYDALVKALLKTNGTGIRGGISTAEDSGISRDRVIELYAHWDTATGKFGHFLEDFYRIVDTYSLRITPFERDTLYRQFLRDKFGDNAEAQDIAFDSRLLRFFRNLRHRDVVISQFAQVNEQRYVNGGRDETTRDSKRVEYEKKASHYMGMSQSPLDTAITQLEYLGSGGGTARDEVERLKRSFQTTITLNDVGIFQQAMSPDLQRKIDDTIREMKAIISGSSHDSVRMFGQFYTLSYITRKMAYFSNIRFDRLV